MIREAKIHEGDALSALRNMEAGSVRCCVTSPPYWALRDYGNTDQIGQEPTPQQYVESVVEVIREVRRVMADDGTLWLNLGDTYTSGGRKGHGTRTKPKDLVGIPWRVAFALQEDGWFLRSDVIWAKPNPMPESVTDRPTRSHEYVFLLTKSRRYFYNQAAVAEPAVYSTEERKERAGKEHHKHPEPTAERNAIRPKKPDKQRGHSRQHAGASERWDKMDRAEYPEFRNLRDVWMISPRPYSEAHFATMPPDLAETCIKAGTEEGDTVLDPFCGSGTTGLVALRLGRRFVGVELNEEYVGMATDRIYEDAPLLNSVEVHLVEK